MPRSYDEAMKPYREQRDEKLKEVVDALQEHFEEVSKTLELLNGSASRVLTLLTGVNDFMAYGGLPEEEIPHQKGGE